VVKWAHDSKSQLATLTMHEIWLRPNYRAIAFAIVPPLVLAALGAWMVFGLGSPGGGWWRWLGTAAIVLSAAMIAVVLMQLRRPRVAYAEGRVLFYLRSGPAIAVPVKVVEAFFLGQGPSYLPVQSTGNDNTVNLVARLSQRELQWAHQKVKPALGHWCDGYVTIRGTWCEPLNEQVIRRLNSRLKDVSTQDA
jgi:hypothetical protein